MMTRRGTKTATARGLVAVSDVNTDYKDKFNEVNHLLTSLKMAVARHSKEREKNPHNWGYNGDLGAVVSKLKDLLEFLGDSENYVRRSSDGWLTAEQVEKICPACADKMRAAGIGRVREELLAVKFDTKKELSQYRQEHGTNPGTKLQLRTKHEMQERQKDRK